MVLRWSRPAYRGGHGAQRTERREQGLDGRGGGAAESRTGAGEDVLLEFLRGQPGRSFFFADSLSSYRSLISPVLSRWPIAAPTLHATCPRPCPPPLLSRSPLYTPPIPPHASPPALPSRHSSTSFTRAKAVSARRSWPFSHSSSSPSTSFSSHNHP